MKTRIFGAFLAPVLAFGLAACTVDQTDDGEMPDVDVEAGELPEYDVDAADVDVNMDTATVRVPDVDINPDTTPDNTPQ